MRKLLVMFFLLNLSFAQEIFDFSGQIVRAGHWDNYGQLVRLASAPQGAVSSNALTAVTAVNGRFLFTGLPAGEYTLQIDDAQGRRLTTALEIPAPDFFWKAKGGKNDNVSLDILNLLLTALILTITVLVSRRKPSGKSRPLLFLVVSFTLYTGTDFLQNLLAYLGRETLAGNIFFLKHIGSAYFGYWFYEFWRSFSAEQKNRDFFWLLPALETLVLSSWPCLGLDSRFEEFWFFSFAQLRLVVMLQLIGFIAAGLASVCAQRRQTKDPLTKNILTVTQYVSGLLLALILFLVLLPLVWRQGAELFHQQYVLTALLFGLILFGWLASGEMYQHLLQTQRELEQHERLSALGALAAGLAHEIKNPLAAIAALVKLLPANYRQTHFRQEFLDIVPRQIERINALLVGLLQLGRSGTTPKTKINLSAALEQSLTLLEAAAGKQNVQIERHIRPALTLRGSQPALEQAFINLGLNALQAMPQGGVLRVSTAPGVIIFQDTGAGIKPEYLTKLFDPFFTTKKSGTGLGLSITKKILDEHKIKIDICSRQQQGARVSLFLP